MEDPEEGLRDRKVVEEDEEFGVRCEDGHGEDEDERRRRGEEMGEEGVE